MAIFTITTNELLNLPPYQTGTLYLTIPHATVHMFTVDNFTIDTVPRYADPENDPLLKIKITYINPNNQGTLFLDNVIVNLNDEILVSDITANKLEYRSLISQEINYADEFTFDVADTGSGSYNNLTGVIRIIVEDIVNNPPNEVGDGEASISHDDILIFDRLMFTTQTTPPYSDPEGDAALNLKILALPSTGQLLMRASLNTNALTTLVNLNQIISFDDIDNGLFIYRPDSTIKTNHLDDFEFAIADAGSGIFVS